METGRRMEQFGGRIDLLSYEPYCLRHRITSESIVGKMSDR